METQTIMTENREMQQLDKLLKLIEEGDADKVLSEENLQKGFNELLKFELVALKDDRIFLTELGLEAISIGAEQVINKLKANPKPAAVVVPVFRKNSFRRKNLYYYLLLVLALLMMLVFQVVLK